ncbi:hypothetical protein [Mycoplasma feriruminatoris]|uniref:Uncharacterized protein n=1 Tax=Mycoplasma feriruminatoris TaxID=1179777 RepID=A0A654IJH0_9MOLU|nr:hypothetical protein [Mycoplasma feriruminatoris]WFQ94624.1 hypothetical protein MFERI15220_00706 [Mycoplasma feriruminatoris]VZK65579.1 hypothetical protein MF5292_00757 [Mycoplasma feriruminatoris]VZR75723.1 hypothetical protein MF5294_00756 [Mycoplasma feriruminatoris]VZR98358.1 hypothetical protein MF5293_00752 [Mycoplasma feriruminatoris]VZR98433.1 hypothetical protein MF5295_00772 [Mycoplasma feriruminatoris]
MIILAKQEDYLPTWAVYLILILGLIGLIISAYGATSAFKYNKKLKNKNNFKKIQNVLSTRQSYSWNNVDSLNNKGYFLVAITLNNFDFNSNEPLITLLKSTDLKTDINEFKLNFDQNKDLVDYLNKFNLTTNDLVFIIVEKVENLDELNKLYLEWNSLINA